jgi:hypothetical protein
VAVTTVGLVDWKSGLKVGIGRLIGRHIDDGEVRQHLAGRHAPVSATIGHGRRAV